MKLANVIQQISVEDHIRGIERMVEDDAYSIDVL
jgi:DNA-binding FrmR family transcriptional regulator